MFIRYFIFKEKEINLSIEIIKFYIWRVFRGFYDVGEIGII